MTELAPIDQNDDSQTLSRRMTLTLTQFETSLAALVELVLEAASSQSATGIVAFADNAAASTDRVIAQVNDLRQQLGALAARVERLEDAKPAPDAQPWRNEP